MAYNYVDRNYTEPFNSDLITNGFKNDITPLDAYNLNILITALKKVNNERNENDITLNDAINAEKSSRVAADEGLSGRITTEETSRIQADEQITGAYQKADTDLKTEIIGNDDDTVEKNTLKGVINYAIAADEELNTKIINEVLGDKDDTISDNTLNGVINEVNDINSLLNALEDTDVISAYPSISLETNIKSYEVGTTIIPNYKLTFVDGKYEYGTESETESAGCSPETWYAEFGIEPSKSEPEGEFESVHISDSTSILFFANCNYSAGDIPNSDLGRPIEKSRIPAGKTDPKRATLSGYRQAFAGGMNSKLSEIELLTSTSIRDLSGKGGNTKSFNIKINADCLRVVIAFPSTWGALTSVLDSNDSNKNICTSFGEAKTASVFGATKNEDAMDYKVYYMDFANAYGGNGNTYKVTIS